MVILSSTTILKIQSRRSFSLATSEKSWFWLFLGCFRAILPYAQLEVPKSNFCLDKLKIWVLVVILSLTTIFETWYRRSFNLGTSGKFGFWLFYVVFVFWLLGLFLFRECLRISMEKNKITAKQREQMRGLEIFFCFFPAGCIIGVHYTHNGLRLLQRKSLPLFAFENVPWRAIWKRGEGCRPAQEILSRWAEA